MNILFLLSLLSSCTENQRARFYGGTASEKLPCDRKLITATWKEENLWVLHRALRADESLESYTFQETSSFGLLEGTVVLTESRCAEKI